MARARHLIVGLVLMTIFAVLPAIAEASNFEPNEEQIEFMNQLEEEINKIDQHYAHAKGQLARAAERALEAEKNSDKRKEISSDRDKRYQQLREEHMQAIRDHLKNRGFSSVGVEEPESDPEFSTSSLASDLSATQGAYASSVIPGTIYYYVYWDWNNHYDLYWDTYDLASEEIRYDNGWRWYSMGGKTWDQFGTRTGWVKNDGSHTGNGITLRNDFWNGRVFNLYDRWDNLTGMYTTYETNLWGWITPGTTSSNQVKSNFEHNYKYYSWNTAATISGVSISNFSLSVSYSKVNGHFLRGTPALTIYKP